MTIDDLDALDRQLQAAEGFRTFLYDDATGKRITKGSVVIGHPTIGYGFNLDAMDLPHDVAAVWFAAKRTQVINQMFNAMPWTQRLPVGPLRAIIDVAYNAGEGGLEGFHKMLAAAQRGDYGTAALELERSKLEPHRAQRLKALMNS